MSEIGLANYLTQLFITFSHSFQTQTIVSTSILSKRWRHIWTTMPSFDLALLQGDHQEVDTKTFQNFIDRMLFLRPPLLKMVKFALRSDQIFDSSKVHEWILKIGKCNIEELNLNLYLDKPLYVPNSLFNCESLVELRLHLHISLHLPKCISLPKLKFLQLSDMCFQATDYTVSSFPSLEDVEINCFNIGSDYLETKAAQIGHAGRKLVGGFSNVRSLMISGETLEALSFAYDDLPTFQNLIHMRVTSEFKSFADKVLLKFFQSAPNLETLVFDKELAMSLSESGNIFWMQGTAFECPFPRLKSVHFKEISWYLREVDLIKLILKNAEDLEMITFKDFTPPSLPSISRVLTAREEFGMVMGASEDDDYY
ncbi:FBD-associated F-box protein At4g10400-like [Papaver somniferum]|uniref:FBD-associated F-box protein At4g10400-like n=1 Tax=Papaver somniferum TaxID=3469 RepID=UPI000E6FB410|nr:FBD-associated F-box protein At4g10400-like [Papaver somniferum]